MAQFDVHRNLGRSRATFPYLVIVQSAQFDRFRRRLMVPLVLRSLLGEVVVPRLNPSFEIEGTSVVLHPLEIASLEVSALGPHIGTLREQGQLICDALDEATTRAWG